MKYLFRCRYCGEEHEEDLSGKVGKDTHLYHHPLRKTCRNPDGVYFPDTYGTFDLVERT